MTTFHGSDDGRSSRTPVVAAVSAVGHIIRYGFYLVGALVLGLIGLVILKVSSYQINWVNEAPSFRVGVSSLDRLASSGVVATSSGIGRIEMRQYGRIYSRDQDFTVALVVPPKNWFGEENIAREIKDIPNLYALSSRFGQNHWDLDTRFGDVRAVDFIVQADGLRKQCLGFLSRFDTTAVYMKGWFCEADGSRPVADHVACLLDRVVLEKPLANKPADAFLRARMGRGMRCGATPVTQTSDPRGSNPALLRKANPYAPSRNFY
jgi:hypothetical protein